MGAVLNADQRRHLDGAVQRARTAAEQAAADALRALAVAEPSRPAYLNDDDNSLRLALREKARQLGDDTARSGADLTNLMREVAYEQWHRLLFARFLEVNGLLRHPEFRDTSLTLDDCADLADDLGEPDGWSVAARFAAEILPGVFRLDDPAVQVRFATEHRLELEKILLSLPSEVFVTEDALGWVYQFWQTAEKKRVNESGVKIGGADLSPVTQLFTENYMVRFLLENSLGAWWAARHPDSPLSTAGSTCAASTTARQPQAHSTSGRQPQPRSRSWTRAVALGTSSSPCSGCSGECAPRKRVCLRRRRRTPCCGTTSTVLNSIRGAPRSRRSTSPSKHGSRAGSVTSRRPRSHARAYPVRDKREEWEALAGVDDELRGLLGRLHSRFREANTLGSLIDPRPSSSEAALIGRDMTVGVGWAQIREALLKAIAADQRGRDSARTCRRGCGHCRGTPWRGLHAGRDKPAIPQLSEDGYEALRVLRFSLSPMPARSWRSASLSARRSSSTPMA